MTDLRFCVFRSLASPAEREGFRAAMEAKGYFAFFAFVEDFRNALKTYVENEIEEIGALLAFGRLLFPNPGRFSPSWDKLWEEFDGIYAAKNETLDEVSPAERDGEWQVLIDNPYLSQQVVCYPSLGFSDAAYMFAYFQKDLKPNEFLRLQKVASLLVRNGKKEASIFPDV